MLQERVIDRALKEPITTDRSRCLRMRFNRNTCSLCSEQCRSDAINIAEDVTVNADKCSECMLCYSVCPSGCFEINGLDFYSMINRVRKIEASVQSPVVGCGRTKSPSHLSTICFGCLSEELLIALYAYIHNPVQIDLTGCIGCNDSMPGIIESRLENIESATGINIYEKIRLVKDSSALDFKDISYDRRSFFRAIKEMTLMQASSLIGSGGDVQLERSYSAKKMPFKREAMNNALKILPYEIRKAVLHNYYFNAVISDACDNCFACTGICPTGALKTGGEDNGRGLLFNSSLCIGCGLCSNICRGEAIMIDKGFSGQNAFEYRPLKAELFSMSVV